MNGLSDLKSAGNRWMDDPEVHALRAYLDANNGIRGLEVLEPADIRHAVELFRRDGFVVIANVLDSAQVEILSKGCAEVASEILALYDGRKGNRGSHRYSFGGSSLTRSQLHRPEWQMLLDIPVVTHVVSGIFGSLLSTLAMASVVTSCRVLPLMRSRSRTKRISTPQSASESIARSEPVTCDATARMATAISGCSHGLNARVTTSSAADLLMVDAHCALSMVAIDASASDSSVSTLLVVLCHAVERRPFLFFLSRSCASMSAAVARCSIVVSFELDLSRVFGADSPPSSGISTCCDG